MSDFNSIHSVIKTSKKVERASRFALYLFPIWGLSWLLTWLAIKKLTVNGPIIPVLLARNVFCFGLGVTAIILGVQGMIDLKKHPGYSTGYLKAMMGITLGVVFIIVEIVTFSLIVLLIIQKGSVL